MAARNAVKPSEAAQTVIPNEAPEPDGSMTFTSPWGTKVTVAAELADQFKDAGYKPAK